MIEEKTRKIIDKLIDEYLDEMRFEFIYLEHNREIKEVQSGKYVIQDTDIIIDRSQSYEEILRHPIEDFFIPTKVNLFVTEFIVTLEPPIFERLIDFDVAGVIRDEEISIQDPRISDNQLMDLLAQTCFDVNYQKIFPEVKEYLQDAYKEKHSSNVQSFLNRIRPIIGL